MLKLSTLMVFGALLSSTIVAGCTSKTEASARKPEPPISTISPPLPELTGTDCEKLAEADRRARLAFSYDEMSKELSGQILNNLDKLTKASKAASECRESGALLFSFCQEKEETVKRYSADLDFLQNTLAALQTSVRAQYQINKSIYTGCK